MLTSRERCWLLVLNVGLAGCTSRPPDTYPSRDASWRIDGALPDATRVDRDAGDALDSGLDAWALPGDASQVVDASFDANMLPPDAAIDASPDAPDSGRDAGSPACLGRNTRAHPIAATLLFQLDTSGSMNCHATQSGTGSCSNTPQPASRWSVFRPALVAAIGTLSDGARVGLMRYPEDTTDICVSPDPIAPIAPLSAPHRTDLATALEGIRPNGRTPTAPAVEVAIDALERVQDDGDEKFLVLATDGAANVCDFCPNAALDCPDEQHMLGLVRAAADHGLRTFVIGVPGSRDFRSVLSQLAIDGETAAPGCTGDECHFDLTSATDFGAALTAALQTIVGAATVPCTYRVPEEDAFDPVLLDVVIRSDRDAQGQQTTRTLRRAIDWDYGRNQTRVVLRGAACDEAGALTTGRVELVYGCSTSSY